MEEGFYFIMQFKSHKVDLLRLEPPAHVTASTECCAGETGFNAFEMRFIDLTVDVGHLMCYPICDKRYKIIGGETLAQHDGIGFP